MDRAVVMMDDTEGQDVDQTEASKQGVDDNTSSKGGSAFQDDTAGRSAAPSHLSHYGNNPMIIVTPPTPSPIMSESSLRSFPGPLLDPGQFTEWKTTTHHGTHIRFTPRFDAKYLDDPPIKYTMYTPRHFLERLNRDHTLFHGSIKANIELGFTRELPHSYLFTVGNPTVPATDKASQWMRWPCENEIWKGGQGDTNEMMWDFKADLTRCEMPLQWKWIRTRGCGSGSGLVEIQLRNRKGKIAALWRSGDGLFRGRLWMWKGTEWDEDEIQKKVVRMRWEAAVLLTWMLMLDKHSDKGNKHH